MARHRGLGQLGGRVTRDDDTGRGDGPGLGRPRCPACGSSRLARLGAPRVIETDIVVSRATGVCRCSVCDLLFFVPVESSESVLGQYAVLSGDSWTGYARPDWDLARSAILRRIPMGSVLDVGCWTGEFVSSLPDSFATHGVEPSDWARAQAAKNGVSVLGASLADVAEQGVTFDAITIIDVLEHATAPLEELSAARRLLSPEGVIIIATGNSRCLAWRMMPRDYWYYFAEHKCFFSKRWFQWAANEIELRLEEARSYAHFPGAFWGPGADLAKACAFRAFGGPRSHPYRALVRTRLVPPRPTTRRSRDHIIVVLGPRR